MKRSDNKSNLNDIGKIWKASDALMNNKYKLKHKDMENILIKESTSFLKKFRANIYFDIVLKCIMCCGLIIMWLAYPSNLLVAGTTLLILILSLLLIFQLAGILKAGKSGNDFTKSTVETIESSIGFYNGQSVIVPLSWGFSSAVFFILGSFIYHHFKYGIINPFEDIQDIMVLCFFMVMGIVLSYTSHHFVIRHQFTNLDKLVEDINDEAKFKISKNKYSKAKSNRYLLGITLSVIGLVLLIALIVFLRK